MKLSKLRYNPNNPRFIRDENFERLKLKIVAYPKFLNGRGIVYDSSDKNTVLGGNQRLRVLRELSILDSEEIENIVNAAFDLFDFEKESSIEILSKLAQSKEIPKDWLFDAANWLEDEKKSFVIIDNVEEGEHDFDILANTWDSDELNNFGVFIPNFESEEHYEDFDEDDEYDKSKLSDSADSYLNSSIRQIVLAYDLEEHKDIYEKLSLIGKKENGEVNHSLAVKYLVRFYADNNTF